MIIDIKKFAKNYNIKIKGVIHIGLHDGNEIYRYIFWGAKNILGFEPNEKIFRKLLKKKIVNYLPWVNLDLENIAVSNQTGISDFYVTSSDQSSSLLKLKNHLKIYPDIKEIYSTKVKTDTLNNIFFNKYKIKNYNCINMDIQGAELLALKGSTKILDKIDIINTELNFDELYEGCGLAHEIDKFLKFYNFYRVETDLRFHHTWGDGLYVKK